MTFDAMHFFCSISLITVMGLIGDNCARCRNAAENDKGLAGRWWRFWAEVRPVVCAEKLLTTKLTEPVVA